MMRGKTSEAGPLLFNKKRREKTQIVTENPIPKVS
jgi:hypothetical protein